MGNIQWQIIDANLNRASEGLRVLEELVRFGLSDNVLQEKTKAIRHKLRHVFDESDSVEQLLKSRNTHSDVGANYTSESEQNKQDFIDLCLANSKRVQEALRVLEEFSKLVETRASEQFKEIRFEMYNLEQGIFFAVREGMK